METGKMKRLGEMFRVPPKILVSRFMLSYLPFGIGLIILPFRYYDMMFMVTTLYAIGLSSIFLGIGTLSRHGYDPSAMGRYSTITVLITLVGISVILPLLLKTGTYSYFFPTLSLWILALYPSYLVHRLPSEETE